MILEGRDYRIRTDGAWVFSREYLLARGTCCTSKCLNCPYEYSRENRNLEKMRPIISMVPSWTETLIAARAHVVGRTRFCIHPQDAVRDITVLGGTKTLATDAAEKMRRILEENTGPRPLVILDKEENPKEFFDFYQRFDCDIEVTHVSDFESLALALGSLASALKSESEEADDSTAAFNLDGMRARVEAVIGEADGLKLESRTFGESLLKSNLSAEALVSSILSNKYPIYYFIWKKPWMVVRSDTWIGEAFLRKFSRRFHMVPKSTYVERLSESDTKYPVISEDQIPSDSILLFSSEPYPFLREWDELLETDFVKNAHAAAIVDGEAYSWFGIRALRFLEER